MRTALGSTSVFCQLFGDSTVAAVKNSSTDPKKTKFLKTENSTPRYSPKEQVCKISAKSDRFCGLQAAPKYLGHTTHRHSQILAQLKLRIFFPKNNKPLVGIKMFWVKNFQKQSICIFSLQYKIKSM